ncbi:MULTISPECIES: hypothetical protein [Lactobacillus]|uniref:Uncharacterized protein n=1 Tax=Lactobacillus xujianguonis TaxID=2495899 RepID=A0A437SSF7_9LACO|nr:MULTISPECIES: hypothetical protein [Lactobacillus]RVU69853.1 hypothetical protein EJK17_10870 [Lactobacillus xujianguonis]RVU72083.1 hypothetical protein EJK20_10920 [Lactobacillus xujianguonis]
MTEEEKNTNQKAEDQAKDEDENSDLEVVMPEANRVTMPAEEYKDQPDYLKTFANFYIAKFGEDDLEIINLYDENHNMVDINKYLLNNIHFPRKVLIKHVLQYHDYNFKNLLNEISKDEDIDPENMKTYEDWDAWYEKRRGKIAGSLS